MSVKLPHSALEALEEPFTSPTGYGLGKSGWVSAGFSPSDPPPDPQRLRACVEESYRAVAPKTLSRTLDP